MSGEPSLADKISTAVKHGEIADDSPFVIPKHEVFAALEQVTTDLAARLRDLGYVMTLHRRRPAVSDHVEVDGVRDEAGVLLDRPSREDLLGEPELPLPADVVDYIQIRVAAVSLGVPEESDFDLFTELDAAKDLGFGKEGHGLIRPDNMVMATCKDGEWTRPNAVPYTQLSFSSNMQALHYGSADFEGMTAEWDEDGNCNVFGMDLHFERINKSNIRLGLDPLSRDLFDKSIITAVQQNARFVPRNGRLYIRPHCADIGAQMRVGNSGTTGFFVEVTPIGSVGAYLGKQEASEAGSNVPMKVMGVPDNKVRAAEGQGDVKAVGSYAQTAPVIKAVRSLRIPMEGLKDGVGPDGVLYLDKFTDGEDSELEGVRICETNASNSIFFENLEDGRYKLVVPSLDHGDILPSNTRALLLEKAKELGWEIDERDVDFREIGAGRFCAAVNCGTAVMLSSFDAIHKVHVIEDNEGVRAELRGELITIRTQEDVNANPTPEPVKILLEKMMAVKEGRSGDEDRAKYLTEVPGLKLKAV